MRRTPPSQPISTRTLKPSAFVCTSLSRLALPSPLDVLDLPAGTGRHAILLAGLGHRVTVADIDGSLVGRTVEAISRTGSRAFGRVVDATTPLPFEDGAFDLVVVTDFVNEGLLAEVPRLLRPGGHLIYESYSARGENWRQLLPPGRTVVAIGPTMETVSITARRIGPDPEAVEAVKLMARRSHD